MIDLLVDGRPLSAASSTRGIGTYLRAIVTRVALEPDITVRALVTTPEALPDGVIAVPIRRRFPNRLNFAEQSLLLYRDIARSGADVFHSPGSDPPTRSATPWVQTVHDIIPVVYPHPKFRAERRRWRARGRRIRNAAAVIADSRHSADDAIRHLGLDAAAIRVVPLGVDPSFRPPVSRPASDPPFLLYVSEYGPHKGFPEAFEVVGRLADKGLPHRLKMVGKMGPRAEMRVRQLLAEARRPDRVDLLNWVTADELRELYQGAALLAMTSRYEGFGFPVLEAMASGTPVVSFDNSSLPEVVGEAGVLVPDGDVEGFSAAAFEVLTSTARWSELSEAGVAWARSFTWDKCAKEHVEVFRDVAVGGGRVTAS